MAQLKDTLVSGSLRATDTVYTTKLQTGILYAPTSSSGTTYGPGSVDNILLSNGSSIYWGTIGDVEVTKLAQTNNITSLNDFIDSTYLIYTAKSGSNTVANKPSGVDAFGALSLKTAQGYQGQLLISSNKSSGLYWRTGIISSNAISTNWLKVLDSNNYTDYTVTKDGEGATGTWGINVSGTAAKLSPISSSDNASLTDTWRSVWMSYNDGVTGRPAVSSVLQYQTSSNTLKAPHFLAEHTKGGGNEFRVQYGSTVDMAFMIGSGNKNHGIWDYKGGATGTGQWMIFADENHNVTVNGNATSATKATQDESGNNIKTNYASSLSVDGTTLTLKSKSGASLSTITLTAANIPSLNASQIAAGTLTVAQGGTGKVSWTQWGVLYASATNTLANTAAGAANTALMGKGSAAPAFVSVSPSVTIATGSTSGPTIKVKVLGVQSSAVAIPAASTSQSGIITTGEQRFQGRKGLPWIDLYAENNGTVSQYCDIIFKNNAGTKVGQIFYDMGHATNITKGRMYFRGYSPATALGTSTTGFYEQFALPSITVGCTTNHTYDILTRKDIWDITETDDLTWADHKTDIPTINTIAYWNGRYSNSSSNLTYCVKGKFTDAAVRDLTNTLDNTNKIPVSSAVKAYIDDSISTIQGTVQGGYVTIAGNAQEVTGRKTLSNLAGASFKPAESSASCDISYNQGLGALVFSFTK